VYTICKPLCKLNKKYFFQVVAEQNNRRPFLITVQPSKRRIVLPVPQAKRGAKFAP